MAKPKFWADYQADKEIFLKLNPKCWGNECDGNMQILKKEELSKQKGCVIVKKCEKCGKTVFFYTYEGWLEAKRTDADNTLRNLIGQQDEEKAALEKAQNYFEKRTMEIHDDILLAKQAIKKWK